MKKDEEELLEKLYEGINAGVELCHGRAVASGWWHDIHTGEVLAANVPEKLCLVHSEISEALEAHRKGLQDDKLPHRLGVEVEIGDAIIRLLDLAGKLSSEMPSFDLAAGIIEKIAFNEQREDHKIENRRKDGGKDY